MAISIDRTRERPRSAPPRPPAPGARLQPAPSRRRIRVPELVLGVVLMGVFALGAVLWQTSSNQRTTIAVLASGVGAGDVIDETDLRPVSVALDQGVGAVAWSARTSLIGQRAVANLPAGTVISAGLVWEQPALAAGEALAGLELGPGDHPADSLHPGDAVAVVAAAGPDSGAATGVVAAEASVWHVAEVVDQPGTVLVTLRLSEADAAKVSAVADQVRLVRVVR